MISRSLKVSLQKLTFSTLLLFNVLVQIACKKTIESNSNTIHDFSIRNFFDAEAIRLSNSKTAVRKITIKGNEFEEIKLTPKNWNEEFVIFSECDINKPAWVRSYSLDSIVKPDYTIVTYSTDENIPLKKIILIKNKTEILSISIEKNTSNFIYESSQNLIYSRKNGYEIIGVQHVYFLSPNQYRISTIFL